MDIEKKKHQIERDELRKIFFEHGLEEKYPKFNDLSNANLKAILDEKMIKHP